MTWYISIKVYAKVFVHILYVFQKFTYNGLSPLGSSAWQIQRKESNFFMYKSYRKVKTVPRLEKFLYLFKFCKICSKNERTSSTTVKINVIEIRLNNCQRRKILRHLIPQHLNLDLDLIISYQFSIFDTKISFTSCLLHYTHRRTGLTLTKAFFKVQISAWGHGSSCDQSFTIKNLYFGS